MNGLKIFMKWVKVQNFYLLQKYYGIHDFSQNAGAIVLSDKMW